MIDTEGGKRLAMVMLLSRVLHFSLLLVLGASSLRGGVDARLMRDPAVSETHIAFVYAGDIWVVPKVGGTAQRLSSPAGEEASPRFSPDGRRVAFTGNYDGNSDLYVMEVTGGPVTRLTHHPAADLLLDWPANGSRLLFASTRESGSRRFNQLYKVADRGGMPQKLPVPFAEMAALSKDAKWVAFTFTRRQGSWKRYRGGTAPDIWLFHLETFESRNVTNHAATDDTPMWHGEGFYFLSDRGKSKRMNLWRYSVATDVMRQVTHFEDSDVGAASIGPSEIVFETDGQLHLLELASETHRAVEISVVTDFATLKPRMEKVGSLIEDVVISPAGKRVVASARGELFSIPAEHGPVLNLTRSSGIAERFPALSPDGKVLAYWTDRGGEYELAVRPAESAGEERMVTQLGAGYRYHLSWAPDSSRVAYIDDQLRIWILRVENGALVEVDQAREWLHGSLQQFHAGWSADSRWLTWSRLVENGNSAVFAFDTKMEAKTQITSGFYSDHDPSFDPGGEYLFYLTEREMNAVYGSLDSEMWTYANSTRIAALPLRSDVGPLMPIRNDVENVAVKEEEDTAKDSEVDEEGPAAEAGSGSGEESDDDEQVEIDFEDLERRLIVLPPRAGNYRGLTAGEGSVFYQRLPNSGANGGKAELFRFDFKERKEDLVLADLGSFTLSADRKRILVRRGPQYAIIDAKKGQKFEKPVRTNAMEMRVDPRAEWNQIFADSWRWYRDFFYDPALHGIDWDSLRTQYQTLLSGAVTRWDVNQVIGDLIAEVNASHVRLGGGDTENSLSQNVGMLGVDWELDGSAYRIERIVRGAAWDADLRSPLDRQGVEIGVGDYVLAVNYQRIESGNDPWAAFAGLAGQTVSLSVNDEPSLEGAREVLVETLNWREESALRHVAWVESNRRRVESLSDGKVGYIYMPNTSGAGQDNLMRQFKAQQHLPALIIDERFNSGGQLANRFLELLDRKPFAYLATRYGPDGRSPAVGHYGPQVMLINGWAGSGGDALPWYFKTAGRGPIVGVRTWGGLVGPAVGHRLVDGGSITVPPMRLYDSEGVWFAEGHGIDPDIELPEDPTALARGTDNQLERGVQEALRLLRSPARFEPPQTPRPEVR